MFVLRFLPAELVDRIKRWDDMKRWERKEIGQTLRQMGLSYREISAVIPVHKGTLSGWCRDMTIDPAHKARLLSGKRGNRRELGTRLRKRALDRAAEIRNAGRLEAQQLLSDPFWATGVTAYWAEGAKRNKDVSFSNSDPLMICLFIAWVEEYLLVDRSQLTLKLHLHSGQEELERLQYWSSVTGIPVKNFRKTYIKPEGTGHRKNVLYNGTANVRVPRSSASLHRILGWIDAVADRYAKRCAKLARGASSIG